MSTHSAIFSREEVAERLAVSPSALIRFESRGFVHSVRHGDLEGYEPAEIRRIWTVVTLQRDLGINLAGIEAILKLRTHLEDVQVRIRELADRLRDVLETPDERGP
ncbi:MAG: hypothetical protein JWN86_2397 [Planctomycetota bacterium]|nr:hypothetical protein [Planctomycetota bacterium]